MYLASHGITEADIGGAVTNRLAAKYFVIHDTSTPNYLDQPFPTNINTATWSHNGLERWRQRPVAHVFVNRLGQSIAPHAWVASQRATKLEVRVLGEKAAACSSTPNRFSHVNAIRKGREKRCHCSRANFTDAQLDPVGVGFMPPPASSMRLDDTRISCLRGRRLPDAHDDPQNFDLALWAKRLRVCSRNWKA
jgi:hypothetical protein